jgi:hypothetical protein
VPFPTDLDASHYFRSTERLQRRKRALVESCELLAPLGEENKATLADALRPVTYDKGDAIIRRGDVGDRFYVLASGEVSIKNDRGDVIGAAAASVKRYVSFRFARWVASTPRRVGSYLISHRVGSYPLRRRS